MLSWSNPSCLIRVLVEPWDFEISITQQSQHRPWQMLQSMQLPRRSSGLINSDPYHPEAFASRDYWALCALRRYGKTSITLPALMACCRPFQ